MPVTRSRTYLTDIGLEDSNNTTGFLFGDEDSNTAERTTPTAPVGNPDSFPAIFRQQAYQSMVSLLCFFLRLFMGWSTGWLAARWIHVAHCWPHFPLHCRSFLEILSLCKFLQVFQRLARHSTLGPIALGSGKESYPTLPRFRTPCLFQPLNSTSLLHTPVHLSFLRFSIPPPKFFTRNCDQCRGALFFASIFDLPVLSLPPACEHLSSASATPHNSFESRLAC